MASYLISPRDIPELIRSLKQTAKEFNEKNKFDKSTDIYKAIYWLHHVHRLIKQATPKPKKPKKTKYIKPFAKEWFKGPPPEIGWWPASTMRNPGTLRYWDGEYWSNGIFDYEPKSRITKDVLKQREDNLDLILWAHRWWE